MRIETLDTGEPVTPAATGREPAPPRPDTPKGPKITPLSDDEATKLRADLRGESPPGRTTAMNVLEWPMRMGLHATGAFDQWAGLKTPEQAKWYEETFTRPLTEMALYQMGAGLPAKALEAVGWGTRLARPIVQAALRTAGTAGTAAGIAKAEERPVMPEVTQSTIGALTGEILLGGANIALARALRRPIEAAEKTAAGQTKAAQAAADSGVDLVNQMVKDAKASRIGQEAGTILPELEAHGKQGLYDLAQGGGKKMLDQIYQGAENEILSRIGGAKAQLNIPALGKDPVTYKQVVNALSDLPVGSARREMRQQLLNELHRLDPMREAAMIYEETGKARGAGLAYLDLVQQSLDKEGRLDPTKLMTLVNQTSGELRKQFGPYWDQAERVLLQGQRVPATLPTPLAAPAVQAVPRARVTGEGTLEALRDPRIRATADAILTRPMAQGAVWAAPRWLTRQALRHLGIPLPGLPGADYEESEP